ncbi:MAG: OmpA family protein [Bacteroidia bacterium]
MTLTRLWYYATAMKFIFLLLTGFLALVPAFGQSPQTYNDGHGGQVQIKMGDLAFADELIYNRAGTPAPITSASNPKIALGKPDFDGFTGGFLSLGCGGEVILKFTDNALINIPGDDLYVFEMGKYVEKTRLYIGKDTTHWIDVGELAGGRTSVDIGSVTTPGETFAYVRLVDLKSDCHGSWPGADIDAVAAIGSGRKLIFRTEFLFDFNQAVLKPSACKTLDSLAMSLPTGKKFTMSISGFTDSLGQSAFNETLSRRRAEAVATYFKERIQKTQVVYYCFGYGELYMQAMNNSEAGRQKNRRVELVLGEE